jgi:hypothetical protein
VKTILHLYDSSVSIPAANHQSLARVVPDAPAKIVLAEFGLKIGSPMGRAHLEATVGWQATQLTPALVFRITRGGQPIFATHVQAQITVNEVQTTHFHFVDRKISPGIHRYQLTAELSNPLPMLSQAKVTGPILFSGISYV